jgi:hypothetical protein
MPANLPPKFFELQKDLKKTQDISEKIEILKEMLAICPKHKGTEKVQRDLKKKIAKFKKELQSSKKGKKGEDFYTVKKEGAGQVVILGPPNSGKTSLINILTGANYKTADYPFTTTLPQPAMMEFEDIQIQLVDTPPLTKEFCPGWLKNITKTSDLILILFDAGDFEIQKRIEEFEEILENWNLKDKKLLFLVNKIDLLKEDELKTILQKTRIEFGISVLKKINLEELKRKIFEGLEIVRIYSKKPGKEPDFSHPFVFKKGSTLSDLIEEIHYELLKTFKFAKLFRKDLRNPLIVGRDYVLKDRDIIEIH